MPADKTLFFDLEAGDLAIEGWRGDTIRPRTWQECRDFAVFIGGPNPALRDDQPYSTAHFQAVCEKFGDPAALDRYETLFVDSITVAGRLCFQWCKGQPQAFSDKTGKPDTRGAYGLHGQEMIAWLTHLQHTRAKNVWFVGIPPDGGGSPIILALDLGTTLGWALRGDTGRIFSGTVCFKPRRFEGGGMRYLRFQHWLEETHRVSGGLQAVYFEERAGTSCQWHEASPRSRRHLGVDAAHIYGGFLSHLTAWCEKHSIPYSGVPVGTIKQSATGKGNANKEAVIKAMQALGYTPSDDNEADALALLHWAIKHHGGQHG